MAFIHGTTYRIRFLYADHRFANSFAEATNASIFILYETDFFHFVGIR